MGVPGGGAGGGGLGAVGVLLADGRDVLCQVIGHGDITGLHAGTPPSLLAHLSTAHATHNQIQQYMYMFVLSYLSTAHATQSNTTCLYNHL